MSGKWLAKEHFRDSLLISAKFNTFWDVYKKGLSAFFLLKGGLHFTDKDTDSQISVLQCPCWQLLSTIFSLGLLHLFSAVSSESSRSVADPPYETASLDSLMFFMS